MQETQENPLEKKMATTPVFLPGESHGQRSLVGYSPWGRKRVRHNWITKHKQQYSIVYMCHIFFIHSSIDGHLGCFHVLAVVNSAALCWTLGCMYLFELWFSLDICPAVGLLDHVVALFLVFKETSVLLFTEAVPVYIPINGVGRFTFLHTLSSIYCL